MTTVRDWLRQRFPAVFGAPEPVEIPAPLKDPPIILTDYGPTDERARRQAEINMRLVPDIKKRVEDLLISQMGSVEAGMAESRRRYPEAYVDDEDTK